MALLLLLLLAAAAAAADDDDDDDDDDGDLNAHWLLLTFLCDPSTVRSCNIKNIVRSPTFVASHR